MGKTATGEGFVSITPSDTVNISRKDGKFPRALYFGVGGTCTIIAPDDSSASFVNIGDGQLIDCDVKRVNSTGLAGCSDIVGIY